MILAVIQSCDACGIEGRAKGMHLPEGWLFFDLRGGKDPGVIGYGWNVCSTPCMQRTVTAWADGKKPMPHGMSEESQVIREHGHDHYDDPAEAEIAALAAAAAERAEEHTHPAPEPLTACAWCEDTAPGADVPADWLRMSVGVEPGEDVVCSIACGRDLLAAVLHADN